MDNYRALMDSTWTIGTVDISIGGIISFLVIIVVTFFLARSVKQLFNQSWVEKLKLPKGLPGAVSMVTRYIVVAFGIYIALSAAGVDLGKFGLIAGALGVGIGFGLQNVVYNFISGLIIAFERPINVGDTIEVGTLMGTVTEVGVRASKVKTFDGSEVIIPNGNVISREVINWTLSDQKRRLMIPVKTVMEADPRQVLKILKEEANRHPNTLKNPEPMALFNGYLDTALDFTLYFWVYFNASLSTKSDVAMYIHDALRENGIELPVPRQRLYYDKENPSDKLFPEGRNG
jgi:small-conductance mechanosensitive channel